MSNSGGQIGQTRLLNIAEILFKRSSKNSGKIWAMKLRQNLLNIPETGLELVMSVEWMFKED